MPEVGAARHRELSKSGVFPASGGRLGVHSRHRVKIPLDFPATDILRTRFI